MISKRYIDTASGQMHLREAGRSNPKPLLLLHQTPSSGVMFESLMGCLANEYWLIAPDLPGFGASALDGQTMSVALWANALMEMLAQLGISQCAIFGHHTGAAVAVQLASQEPGLCEKLLLSGPPLISLEVQQKLLANLPSQDMMESGEFLLAAWQRLRQKDVAAPLALALRELISSLALRDRYEEAYRAVFEQDFAGQLATIGCPILLMAGEHDSLRASLEPAVALVQTGRSILIPDAGTYICDRQPEKVAQLIREFLS